MDFNPKEYDVPEQYRHWVGDKAEDHIGPFFFYMDGDQPRTAFRAREQNCNAHNTVHGGVLMAFADYTLCMGANGGENESVVTVSMNSEFTAPAEKGDLILGHCEVVRRGRSMVFVRCELVVNEQVVLMASAVVKMLRKRAN
ncbi:MAG: PaaI family thioesterase [Pseudohongiellaceae bacterium]